MLSSSLACVVWSHDVGSTTQERLGPERTERLISNDRRAMRRCAYTGTSCIVSELPEGSEAYSWTLFNRPVAVRPHRVTEGSAGDRPDHSGRRRRGGPCPAHRAGCGCERRPGLPLGAIRLLRRHRRQSLGRTRDPATGVAEELLTRVHVGSWLVRGRCTCCNVLGTE